MVDNFSMDDDAARLFQELGGIDEEDRTVSQTEYTDMLAKNLAEVEERLDSWRILLIELTSLLSAYFKDVHLWEGGKSEQEFFDKLGNIFAKLAQHPNPDRSVFIRYRGFQSGTEKSGEVDYIVIFGDIVVDLTTTLPVLMKRQGIGASHLGGKLSKAFQILSEFGINNLYLKIPDPAGKEVQNLWTSLRILTRYYQALRTNSIISFKSNGKQTSIPVIRNEKNQPDANLSLVAGLNQLKPESMQSLVERVHGWMKQSVDKASGEQMISVYNSIFTVKNLKEKLIQPPVEVNNVKWLIVDEKQEVISKEKAHVAGFIAESFAGNPLEASRMMSWVKEGDFDEIDSQSLGERLEGATDLMFTVEESPDEAKEIGFEVLDSIKGRMEEVQEEIFEDIEVRNDIITISQGDRTTVLKQVHKSVLEIMAFFKGRYSIRKKMREIVHHSIDFDAQDYEMLSIDFGITVDDARHLIKLLKNCFDDRGNFRRGMFERNIQDFIRYEDKVFEFLWYYLNQIQRKQPRYSFLNALQTLIAKIKNPQSVIQLTLSDFYRDPLKVEFSDRNGLILANLLVRKYNKEVNLDIEITPEEVLLVREGLNKAVTDYASDTIDKNQESLFGKVKTIHKKVAHALGNGTVDGEGMSLDYLLSLERELYIFLSLTGGETSRLIMRSAMAEYSDPASEIYQLKNSRNYIPVLLKHLRVLVRGIGRVGNDQDLALLKELRNKESAFKDFARLTKHEDLVHRIMEFSLQSSKNILRFN